MPFAALVLQTDPDDAERLSDALLAAGALSVDLEDALAGTSGEKPLFDELGEVGRWTRLRLTALFSTEPEAARGLRDACNACVMQAPAHETRMLADDDWVQRSRSQFVPIRVSPHLWIVPSWHMPPDPRAINVFLDPGVAFGTGNHATTRLCLRWLEKSVTQGGTVIDYGCGSGILAIAASKLGAGSTVGVDIDPGAVAAARSNAERNGVAAEFLDSHAQVDFTADLVVANILANPLKLLAPVLARLCRVEGRLALSGILSPQAAEIQEAYAPWFVLGECEEEEGWLCLSGTRR